MNREIDLDLCEWNPETRCAATVDKIDGALRHTGCQNLAEISVGHNGQWRLCATCAADSAFGKLTKRVPIHFAMFSPEK